MFLQVLWSLERLATELAFVRLEWHVDANVRGNVIAFDCCCSATSPLAGQVEVVGRLATDMALADMVLISFVSGSIIIRLAAGKRFEGLHRGSRAWSSVRRILATGTLDSHRRCW